MPVTLHTIHPYQVDFDTFSWDLESGGPMEASYADNPTVLKALAGEAMLPTCVEVVQVEGVCYIKLADMTVRPTWNTKSTLVLYCKGNNGNKKATMTNMKYVGTDGSQIRANPGEVVLRFDHESADGLSDYLTWSAVT